LLFSFVSYTFEQSIMCAVKGALVN